MSGRITERRHEGRHDPSQPVQQPVLGGSGRPFPSTLVAAAGAGWLSSRPRLLVVTRLAELAGTLVVSVLTLDAGTPGATPALVGIVVGSLAWLAWIAAGDRRWPALAALVTMAAAGGSVTGSRGGGLFFVGVSASGAAFAADLAVAVAVACPALVAWTIASSMQGSFPRHVFELIAVALLGIVSGGGRRQLLAHGRQVTLLATAEARAAVAEQEAELLAERNRLGRDLHDVLAHTLGAVSIQLTALDSRVAAGDGVAEVRARIAAIHRLVGDGLGEARDAVRALREDGLSLEGQLGRLCELHGAVLDVRGPPVTVATPASLALYRAVQEALTNAEKHAPHAPVTVQLRFAPEAVQVRIDNPRSGPRSESRVADSGAGLGLTGMRERLQLAGGQLDAGPTAEGWHVHATVPNR